MSSIGSGGRFCVNHVVGIVADFNRDRENDYISGKCCVFGMEEEEFQVDK